LLTSEASKIGRRVGAFVLGFPQQLLLVSILRVKAEMKHMLINERTGARRSRRMMRRIVANIAKLPEPLRKGSLLERNTPLHAFHPRRDRRHDRQS